MDFQRDASYESCVTFLKFKMISGGFRGGCMITNLSPEFQNLKQCVGGSTRISIFRPTNVVLKKIIGGWKISAYKKQVCESLNMTDKYQQLTILNIILKKN